MGSLIPPLPSVGDQGYTCATMRRGATRQGKDVRRRRNTELGVIDYTLAKRALIRDAHRGLRSVADLCDAHPELMRAAKHVGEATSSDCPVCGKDKLVLLAYVFGSSLGRNSGRVWPIQTGLRLTAAHPGSACYVVEVCRSCAWNHLREAFTARRRAAAG
ncbi:MAG: hypothetical protein K0R20_2002 [Actinomycetia bacterium]|nr:hypothetical protein [Actinomycetes bacterium]